MKTLYENLEIEMVLFDCEDVITSSGNTTDEENHNYQGEEQNLLP